MKSLWHSVLGCCCSSTRSVCMCVCYHRWMLGEAHDYEFPDAPPISIEHTYSSAKILEVALIWSLVYYIIILPFDLLPCSPSALEEYDDGTLQPRFSCFVSFRQYENLHMLFWIAKDLAWNLVNLSFWLFCLVPAVLLALDFIYISVTTKSEVWSLLRKFAIIVLHSYYKYVSGS
jgi:hypothetical protein